MILTYNVDLPYPSTDVESPNSTYAKMILDNVGGRNSEMTAISSYYFNSLNGQSEEVCKLYRGINQVEMKHAEIFGNLAKNLGERPLFWSTCGHRRTWWSPSYTDYPLNLLDMLWASIEGEKSAIEKYQLQLRQIDDFNIKENLRRIILDEQHHVRLLTDLYEKYAE